MKRYLILLSALSYLMGGCADNLERRVIHTANAPEAIGPYSQAILMDDDLYLSGQIAIDPATGQMVTGGIKEQTNQVLKNIRSVLEAAGYEFKHVVQVQIFLTDLDEYGTVNQIYTGYFNDEPPARAVVEVARLPKDALIEILVTARK